ncbi:MAG: hypothetical protein NTW19_10650 [Planctomycetota bacterium]|nr:hypothetical protein [Planctomycetota bacterium]
MTALPASAAPKHKPAHDPAPSKAAETKPADGKSPAAEPAPAADAAVFKVIPTEQLVRTMALTEDNKFLVLAHMDGNTLTAWDVATGKIVATLATPAPQALLCRGADVYVGSRTDPAIHVFSQKDWKPSNELAVGRAGVYQLSAAAGPNFKGQILAVCGSEGESEVVLIDGARDTHRVLDKTINADVSWNGAFVLASFHTSVANAGFGWSDYIAGRHDRNSKEKVVDVNGGEPFMYQVADGYWFADEKVMGGQPIAPVREAKNELLVPDRAAKVVYVVGRTTVTALGLNAAFPEYGTREAVWPREVRDGFDAVYNARRRREARIFDAPLAVTLDGRLHLFVIDYKRNRVLEAGLPAFAVTGSVAGATPGSTPGSPGSTPPAPSANDPLRRAGWPATLTAGTKIHHQVSTESSAIKLALVTGPNGAALNTDGYLDWTPTEADQGEQTFKFRSERNGQVAFHRLSVAVLSAKPPETPMAVSHPDPTPARPGASGGNASAANTPKDGATPRPATPAGASAGAGRNAQPAMPDGLAIENGEGCVIAALDGKSMFVTSGRTLYQLDADGLKVLATHPLEHTYKALGERPDGFVALGSTYIDFLEKGTFKLRKNLPLGVPETTDMALSPNGKVAYVAVFNDEGGKRDKADSRRVLEVTEATGQIRELPGVAGQWVVVHPGGRYLYTGMKDTFKTGRHFDWNLGMSIEDFDSSDVMIRYDLNGPQPRRLEYNVNPGANGSHLRIAPDGGSVAYISGAGCPRYSYAIPAFDAADVKRALASYSFKGNGYPHDVVFHPKLDLVAANSDQKVWLFERSTGEKLANRFEDGSDGPTKPRRVFFSASRTHVLIDSENKSGGGHTLRSYALKLEGVKTMPAPAAIPEPGPAPMPPAKPSGVRTPPPA